MLQVGSALKGYSIEASDGIMGTVGDFLFDDRTWKVRWLVVDTGGWLTGRLVLVHPSVIKQVDDLRRVLGVSLTKAQVKASPELLQHQPVSRQVEDNLYNYYGWDPVWGSSFFGMNAALPDITDVDVSVLTHDDNEDPHLRSMSAVIGYHIQATDGSIGHLENVLLQDEGWTIRYLIIDTKNWWAGQHVLISPYAVRQIDWAGQQISLDIARGQVKSSPPWAPLDLIDQVYEQRLHRHYEWPGYGW